MQKNDFDKALNLAYFFLKFRPRTTREVERYLLQRAQKYRFSPETIPLVLEELQKQDFLDDAKFVEMYVHDRLRFKPRGSLLLRNELQKLGIAKELITAFFEENPTEDKETAVSLLRKKTKRWTHLPSKKRFLKAVSYLKTKGFSYGDSVSAYKEIEGGAKNPFEDLSPTE